MSAKAVPSAADATLRGGFLAAIFLMATSAIGPGFITQTATFTAKLGAAFAFAISAFSFPMLLGERTDALSSSVVASFWKRA